MLINDHMENVKQYNIPKAQLIIADIPYNVGNNAYASSPQWYEGGDRENGESKLANKSFFRGDENFNVYNFFMFATRMLRPEPKETGKSPCMIVFCEFEQQFELIQFGKEHGLPHYLNLVFYKNYSPQVLKANQRIVGNAEYAVLFYRDKLPKFNNNGRMVFNCLEYKRDTETPKVHPTQKSIHVIRNLIELFTDPGDVVIDPCAGSGVTLLAAECLGRKSYGFECKREFCHAFESTIAKCVQTELFTGAQ
ncbi:site-specific DNA-methyltransferase [Treponema primitia]|uniref:DNA-methyltransferase n=1 Tax=Treponema primitia TaxID=88058 RepID=UPI00398178F1